MKNLNLIYKLYFSLFFILISKIKKNSIHLLSIFLLISTSSLYAADQNPPGDLVTLPYTEVITLPKNKSNYFQFNLTTTGDIVVRTTGATYQINASLFESDGSTLVTSQNGSNDIDIAAINVAGPALYKLQIDNTEGPSGNSVDYTLEIYVNQTPVANDKSYSTEHNTSVTGNVITDSPADSDPDGDTLTISANTNPSNGNVSIDSNGSFTYSPNDDFNGTDSFTYTISDGHGKIDTATVTIIVNPPNNPPIANDKNYEVPFETSISGNVMTDQTADSDPDGDLLTVIDNTTPIKGSVFINTDGSFTYTPYSTQTGPDSFTYTISDGRDGNATATINLNIISITPPTASPDEANTSKNVAVTIDILNNDTSGSYAIDTSSVIISSPPNEGTVVIETNGSITYTPETDYVGNASFTYRVGDVNGYFSNPADVDVTVNGPIANDDNISTPKNVDVNITVTANDTPISTIDVTTVTIIDNPTVGSVTLDATTGIVTYTPQTDWFGNDTFTYTVDDLNGITSNVATVTVSVISEQVCHDSATELLYATAYGDSATDNNDNTGLTSNDTKIYKVYLDIDGILENNITNGGTEGLDFDFSKDCSSLLTVTRFGIDDGDTVSLPLVLDAGWYYMAFSGEKSNAATLYRVTVTLLNPFAGGGTGVIGGGDADIVNNFISTTDYNNGTHYITTKIAGDASTSITGVYLDDVTGLASNYADASGNDLWFMIIPYWSDSSCSTIDQVVKDTNGDPLVMQITNGSPSVTASIQVPPKAVKDARFKITYLDLGAIYALTGDRCILQSSTSGNLQGLGQCINSPAIHYEPNFGTPAYYRCVYGNGQPCLSSHHGYSCGPTDTTCPNYNELYDNEYGCLMCTLGANETCSNDNMSVRPETYSMNLDNVTSLLTSGQFYDLDANATYEGGGTSPTPGYTIVLDNTNEKNASHIFNPDVSTTTCPPAGVDGNFTIPFINGVGSTSITYQNVGDVNITLVDGNWTTVDQKSPLECTPGSDSSTSNPVGCLIKGTLQYRYIPGGFDINATLEDHNSANDFTYLNDTHIDDSYDDMAALLDVNVSAKSLTGETLSHYITGCYAKDTDLTLTLSGMNITYPGALSPQALTQFLYYNTIDGEGNTTLPTATTVSSVNTIAVPSLTIDNSTLVFPVNAPDGNGTAAIEYKLNFNRRLDRVVNPFQIVLTDLNITDTDGVDGNLSSISDQNATLYYARSRASKFFYEDIETSSVKTPIAIDIYCNLGFTPCTDMGIDVVNGEINELNWWLSLDHNRNSGDGNITLKKGAVIEGSSADWSVTQDVIITANAIDDNITVDRGTVPTPKVPLSVIIDLDETTSNLTNTWLIYNPDSDVSAPSPFYKVRFLGDSVWTGVGATGAVINRDASKTKSKRLDW